MREIVESIRAGAVAIHVHPRDPATGLVDSLNYKLLCEVLAGVFAEVKDVVTLNHTWTFDLETHVVDYIKGTAQVMEVAGGNKYCQASVVLPIDRMGMHNQYFTRQATKDGVQWLEENQVKPLFMCYDTYAHIGFRDHIFAHGLAKPVCDEYQLR